MIATDGWSFIVIDWLRLTLQNYLGDEAPFWLGKVDQDWSMSTRINTTVTIELLWTCEHDVDRKEGGELVLIDDPGTFTEINAATIIAKF